MLLFFCKHHHTINEISSPLLRKAKTLIVLSNGNNRFDDASITKVILIEYIVYRFLCHLIQHLLHKAWKTKFEFHQVGSQHHDILNKSLELIQVRLYILQFLTTTAYTLIYFLKELIIHPVHLT